jgi:hypothetical protein
MKTRANSAPVVPKDDGDSGRGHGHESHNPQASPGLDRTDEDNEGEEIADDAFFQRYTFTQPIPLTQQEDAGSSAESSSDTEGPLSPTHFKDRQQAAGDTASEPSTGVSAPTSTPCTMYAGVYG